ncbi:uncharacterized protein LOC132383602 isoform X1 [Hypanus sabinus]|uniref:uncharacterized protein LOC132383602 isoform X1 n=1 Tax=Hypanus sabinus TaxID=79690 RepID=UPI0028C49A76|nr:uncharacterized protein LOC132383602 isoform X1 [Hypanus sabinus]
MFEVCHWDHPTGLADVPRAGAAPETQLKLRTDLAALRFHPTCVMNLYQGLDVLWLLQEWTWDSVWFRMLSIEFILLKQAIQLQQFYIGDTKGNRYCNLEQHTKLLRNSAGLSASMKGCSQQQGSRPLIWTERRERDRIKRSPQVIADSLLVLAYLPIPFFYIKIPIKIPFHQ